MGGQSYSRAAVRPGGRFGEPERGNGAMPTITYSSSDAAPGARAAIAYLLDAAGVPARPAEPGEAATLVHGDIAMAEGGLRIPNRTG